MLQPVVSLEATIAFQTRLILLVCVIRATTSRDEASQLLSLGFPRWYRGFSSRRLIIALVFWSELHGEEGCRCRIPLASTEPVGVTLKRRFKSCNRQHMQRNLFGYLLVR